MGFKILIFGIYFEEKKEPADGKQIVMFSVRKVYWLDTKRVIDYSAIFF